jgi:hypothetical protein
MAIQSILTIRVLLNIRKATRVRGPTSAEQEISTLAFEMRPHTTSEGAGVPSDEVEVQSEGGEVPSDEVEVQSEGGEVPSDGEEVPFDGVGVPSDGDCRFENNV